MRKLSAVSLAVLLLLVATFRSVETLPAQLSDAAFWQVVTDSSESGGTFLSENFLSNERGFQYVIPPLLQTVQSSGAYIGVGPEQNFTYVAAFHPKIAFIVDIRRQNMIEHLLYKSIFEMAPNRAEFLSLLFSRKPPSSLKANFTVEELFNAFDSAPLDAEFYQKNLHAVKDLLLKQHKFELTTEDEASLDHVYDAIAKAGVSLGYSVSDAYLASRIIPTRIFDVTAGIPTSDPNGEIRMIFVPVVPANTQTAVSVTMNGAATFPTYADLMTATDAKGANWSYLATEGNYKTVRDMHQKNLIVPIVGDFAGPKAIRAVGQYLKDHDLTVSVFYLSNVEQYLTPSATLKRFYDNVATLPLNASSSFIRSAQATGIQPGIVQSSASSISEVLDAVIEGRAQSFADILRMSH